MYGSLEEAKISSPPGGTSICCCLASIRLPLAAPQGCCRTVRTLYLCPAYFALLPTIWGATRRSSPGRWVDSALHRRRSRWSRLAGRCDATVRLHAARGILGHERHRRSISAGPGRSPQVRSRVRGCPEQRGAGAGETAALTGEERHVPADVPHETRFLRSSVSSAVSRPAS